MASALRTGKPHPRVAGASSNFWDRKELTGSWSRIPGGVGMMSGSQGHYHSNCNPGRAHHTLGLSSLKACSPRLAGPLKSSGAAPAEALHRWCYMARNTSPRAQGPEDAAQDSVLPWDRQRLGGHRTAMTFLPLCSPELCRSATLPP